jgi:hypothetical protein
VAIDDFSSCPHCGGNLGYYQKFRVSGIVIDNTLFKRNKYTDEREKYNSEMHDALNYKPLGKYYYCMECGNKICRII